MKFAVLDEESLGGGRELELAGAQTNSVDKRIATKQGSSDLFISHKYRMLSFTL